MANYQETLLYGNAVSLMFYPDRHVYYVRVGGEDLGRVRSTTSITGVRSKGDALIWWAANETAKYFERKLDPGRRYDEVEIDQMVKKSRYARFSSSDRAMNIGTIVHDTIEDYVKECIKHGSENVGVLKPDEDVDKAYKSVIRYPYNEEANKALDQFFSWVDDHDIEWLHSERKIYSVKYNYAGTLDIEAIIDGKYTLLDWKTSKGIYPGYRMQIGSYIMAREEEEHSKGNDDYEIEQGLIVRVPKDGSEFEVLTIDDREELEDHKQGFIHCLGLYEWNQKYDKD